MAADGPYTSLTEQCSLKLTKALGCDFFLCKGAEGKRMRAGIIFALLGAVTVSGCQQGAIGGRGLPWRTEPASAVIVGGLGPGVAAPEYEVQFDLAYLLKGELANSGVEVRKTKSLAGITRRPPTGERSSGATVLHIVESNERDERNELEQLIAGVHLADDPVGVRNRVAASWMRASVTNCNVYLRSLRGGQVSSRLLTDVLAGLFSSVSSLTTPQSSAQIFAALGAQSVATGASVDRNVFAQQGAELIADSIDQIRAERRVFIESRLRQSYDNYPMALALTDLAEFHGDCSMLRGFARMREVVLAREETISAVRTAAAAVATAGGDGLEVAAVLAGLDQNGERIQPVAGGVFGPVMAGDLAADLNRMRTTARDCFDRAVEGEKAEEDCRPGPEWEKIFLGEVEKAAAAFDADPRSEIEATKAQALADARGALEDAIRRRMEIVTRARTVAAQYLSDWSGFSDVSSIETALASIADLAKLKPSLLPDENGKTAESGGGEAVADAQAAPGGAAETDVAGPEGAQGTQPPPAPEPATATQAEDPFFIAALQTARALQVESVRDVLKGGGEEAYNRLVASQALNAAMSYVRLPVSR